MRKKYTVAEVAAILNLEESRIHRDIQRGKLRGVKAGRDWLFTYHDLELYVGEERAKELFEKRVNDK